MKIIPKDPTPQELSNNGDDEEDDEAVDASNEIVNLVSEEVMNEMNPLFNENEAPQHSNTMPEENMDGIGQMLNNDEQPQEYDSMYPSLDDYDQFN